MQANWSLALNILLLMVVIIAIVRLMRTRKKNYNPVPLESNVDQKPSFFQDDVISVRKINTEMVAESLAEAEEQKKPSEKENETETEAEVKIKVGTTADVLSEKASNLKPPLQTSAKERTANADIGDTQPALMMFLLAKENRLFAGYELLQTILAAGLRFGEGQLFHRHQFANGQGPVLCSLAAATPSGVFDLQNIGAFTVRGLCLFMQASDNPNIDEERFTIMLDTARQLSEGLNAHLLDDKRRPLTEQRIARYFQMLNLHALS